MLCSLPPSLVSSEGGDLLIFPFFVRLRCSCGSTFSFISSQPSRTVHGSSVSASSLRMYFLHISEFGRFLGLALEELSPSLGVDCFFLYSSVHGSTSSSTASQPSRTAHGSSCVVSPSCRRLYFFCKFGQSWLSSDRVSTGLVSLLRVGCSVLGLTISYFTSVCERC